MEVEMRIVAIMAAWSCLLCGVVVALQKPRLYQDGRDGPDESNHPTLYTVDSVPSHAIQETTSLVLDRPSLRIDLEGGTNPPDVATRSRYDKPKGRKRYNPQKIYEVKLEESSTVRDNLLRMLSSQQSPAASILEAAIRSRTVDTSNLYRFANQPQQSLLGEILRVAPKYLHSTVQHLMDTGHGSSTDQGDILQEILTSMRANNTQLSPRLFFLILDHLPLGPLTPVECQMTKSLGKSLPDSREWLRLTGRLTPADKADPHTLVRAVLLYMNDILPGDIPSYFLTRIVKPDPTATFKPVASINRQEDITNLLAVVPKLGLTQQVLHLTLQILHFLRTERIDMDGIRDTYHTPSLVDLLTEVLIRLNTYHHIPQDIRWAITSLVSHLTFNKHLYSGSVRTLNLPLMAHALVNSNYNSNIRQLITEVVAPELARDPSILAPVIRETPPSECPSPEICFRNLLRRGLDRNVFKSEQLAIAAHVLSHTLQEVVVGPRMDDTQEDVVSDRRAPWHAHIQKAVDDMPEGVKRIPVILPDPTQEEFPMRNGVPLEYLLPRTTPGSDDHKRMAPLRAFLSTPNLIDHFPKGFKSQSFPLRGILLRDLLKQALEQHLVDIPFFNKDVQLYLAGLEGLSNKTNIEIHWESLLTCLPDTDTQKYAKISQFLKPTLTPLLGSIFDKDYRGTKGNLLGDVLQHAKTLPSVRKDPALYEAITYYTDKVLYEECAKQPIELVMVQHQVVSRTVDLNAMFRAFDADKFDRRARKSYNHIFKFFTEEFKPERHLSGFDFTTFNTKGEWLTGFINHLLQNNLVTSRFKRHFRILLPYVRLTGPGAEPVEYVD